MKITIHALRRANIKCKIGHYRYVQSKFVNWLFSPTELKNAKNATILPRGGKTSIKITLPNGKNYESIAQCNLTDNFNHKIANQICLGRIKKQMEKDGIELEKLIKE